MLEYAYSFYSWTKVPRANVIFRTCSRVDIDFINVSNFILSNIEHHRYVQFYTLKQEKDDLNFADGISNCMFMGSN